MADLTEIAAWHGLATNGAFPPAERLANALKALDMYEAWVDSEWGSEKGFDRGYRKAIADLRDEAAYNAWWDRFTPSTATGRGVRAHLADFLESRLTKEGESRAE